MVGLRPRSGGRHEDRLHLLQTLSQTSPHAQVTLSISIYLYITNSSLCPGNIIYFYLSIFISQTPPYAQGTLSLSIYLLLLMPMHEFLAY